MSSLKARSLALKSLSLHELEKLDTSFVFVINNTSPKGNINLTVADGMGNQIGVRVPVANIPYDLSTQATKSSLISNPQLRTLVAKRAILFVHPDHALEFLNTRDAREEHNRLFSMGEIAAIGDSSELESKQAEASGELHPFAMMLANSSEGSDDEQLSQLKGREDEFTEEDYVYIATNSSKEKVKTWAAERANSFKK